MNKEDRILIGTIEGYRYDVSEIIRKNNLIEYGTVDEVLSCLLLYIKTYLKNQGQGNTGSTWKHKGFMRDTNMDMFYKYRAEFNKLVANVVLGPRGLNDQVGFKGLLPAYYSIVSQIVFHKKVGEVFLADATKIDIMNSTNY